MRQGRTCYATGLNRSLQQGKQRSLISPLWRTTSLVKEKGLTLWWRVLEGPTTTEPSLDSYYHAVTRRTQDLVGLPPQAPRPAPPPPRPHPPVAGRRLHLGADHRRPLL